MLKTPPYQEPVDTKGGSLAASWMQWFNQLFQFLSTSVVDYTQASVQSPSTGFSITVPEKIQVLTLDPLGVLSSGTITMPASPVDGQPLQVSSTQTITTLSVLPNVGQSIKNSPTTLLAGSGFSYYYHMANTTWYRNY